MQAERVAGFKEFIEDVKSGAFPAAGHVVKAPDGLIDAFLERADRNERKE
jgi:3-methyl-2-oxobutanoate hydroxymethyltransferase